MLLTSLLWNPFMTLSIGRIWACIQPNECSIDVSRMFNRKVPAGSREQTPSKEVSWRRKPFRSKMATTDRIDTSLSCDGITQKPAEQLTWQPSWRSKIWVTVVASEMERPLYWILRRCPSRVKETNYISRGARFESQLIWNVPALQEGKALPVSHLSLQANKMEGFGIAEPLINFLPSRMCVCVLLSERS